MFQVQRLGLFFLIFNLLTSICYAKANLFFDKQHETWSRLYVGGNLGVVGHNVNVTDNQANSFYATIVESSNPQFSGGFQVGTRFTTSQEKLTAIYGLEFSTHFSNAKFQNNYGSSYALYEINAQNTLQNIYLLEALAGIALDKTYLFLGAGLSWTNLFVEMKSIDGVPYFDSFNQQQQSFGTALSAGVEYVIYKNISTRFKVDVVCPNDFNATDNLGSQFGIKSLVVQGLFGINYLF